MTTDYSFYQNAAKGSPPPTMSGGASGYFSEPSSKLDPALFDDRERLRRDVRHEVLSRLTGFLGSKGLKNAHRWLHAWITGSAISYQYAADNGSGDLDVMVGVDFTKFSQENPDYEGTRQEEFARRLTDAMKADLWPGTSHMDLGGKAFEVTYFLNPGTEDDVVAAIHPYAAYDLIHDRWIVRPPKLPQDPRSLYPKHWFAQADQDRKAADRITDNFNDQMLNLNGATPGSPGWHNAGAALQLLTAQATSLFHEIHTGRQAAFSGRGEGYRDWGNFRWQAGKQSGVIQAMHQIMTVGEDAKAAEETEKWGAPIEGSEVALQRAASVHRNTRL